MHASITDLSLSLSPFSLSLSLPPSLLPHSCRQMEKAKEIIKMSFPIKCLEAVIVALYLTAPLSTVQRVAVSFKSRCAGTHYRYYNNEDYNCLDIFSEQLFHCFHTLVSIMQLLSNALFQDNKLLLSLLFYTLFSKGHFCSEMACTVVVSKLRAHLIHRCSLLIINISVAISNMKKKIFLNTIMQYGSTV